MNFSLSLRWVRLKTVELTSRTDKLKHIGHQDKLKLIGHQDKLKLIGHQLLNHIKKCGLLIFLGDSPKPRQDDDQQPAIKALRLHNKHSLCSPERVNARLFKS